MPSSVQQRSQYLGTFRWIEVQLMEILAGWVPSTPEMEAKVVFGRHLWDCAQHADTLGKRTFELRAALHHSVAPVEEYCKILEVLAETDDTNERLSFFYDILLPDLSAKYQYYAELSDPLMDEPSIRIIERICADIARMIRESNELRTELANLSSIAIPRAHSLAQLVTIGHGDFVNESAPL